VDGYCRTRRYRERRCFRPFYLALADIELTRTNRKSYHTNGICEPFHKTVLDEFYRVTFRRKIYTILRELQAELDEWLDEYNNARPYQGKHRDGRTPCDTLVDGKAITREKLIAA
jgi:transposase InsO family protein